MVLQASQDIFFIKIRQSDATENAFDIIRDTVP